MKITIGCSIKYRDIIRKVIKELEDLGMEPLFPNLNYSNENSDKANTMTEIKRLALEHYQLRQRKIEEWGLDHFRSREPRLARLWGYEPGTKKKRRGGLTDDDFDIWHSKDPVIDIRYWGTFSSPKIHLKDFKHPPKWWKEINIKDIPKWNSLLLSLRGMNNS